MHFFTFFLLLLVSLILHLEPIFGKQKKVERAEIKPTLGSPDRTPIKTLSTGRTKRSSPHVLSECMSVTSEEGRYFYKASHNSDQVCGVYFFTDPDKIIEIHFEYFDVPCQNGGLVSFVDGWELNGEFFPSVEDHKKAFEDRFKEFCSIKKIKNVLLTSQNAGLLQYRIPKKGNGFSFNVRFLKIPNPCNIMAERKSNVYTLSNFGKAVNCSLMAMFPAKVKILALNVGVVSPLMRIEMETGTVHKCGKRGLKDLVELGGNSGLETSKMAVVEDLCGLDSKPQRKESRIFCETTIVKLISSGEFDNSVTIMIQQADEKDLLEPDLVCDM